MSKNVIKLTPAMLRKLVLEEKAKMLQESDPVEAGITDTAKVKPEEVDAADLADTLAKDIDFMAALKIQENKLKSRLRRVNEQKLAVQERILRRASKK